MASSGIRVGTGTSTYLELWPYTLIEDTAFGTPDYLDHLSDILPSIS